MLCYFPVFHVDFSYLKFSVSAEEPLVLETLQTWVVVSEMLLCAASSLLCLLAVHLRRMHVGMNERTSK
jgi:hypothetical protein